MAKPRNPCLLQPLFYLLAPLGQRRELPFHRPSHGSLLLGRPELRHPSQGVTGMGKVRYGVFGGFALGGFYGKATDFNAVTSFNRWHFLPPRLSGSVQDSWPETTLRLPTRTRPCAPCSTRRGLRDHMPLYCAVSDYCRAIRGHHKKEQKQEAAKPVAVVAPAQQNLAGGGSIAETGLSTLKQVSMGAS